MKVSEDKLALILNVMGIHNRCLLSLMYKVPVIKTPLVSVVPLEYNYTLWLRSHMRIAVP